MVSPATSDRICRLLQVGAGALLLVGLVVLFYGAGIESFNGLKLAGLWYLHRQLSGNILFDALLLATTISAVGLLVVAARASAAFRRDIERGAVPTRQVEAVAEDRLIAEARARLEPVLGGGKRVERMIDALLGLPADLGAGGLLLEPGPTLVEVRLLMAMQRLAVGSLPLERYAEVLDQLRRMTGIEGETGRGRLDLRSADGVEPIRISLDQGVHGIKARVQLLNRAGFNLTIEELDLPKPALTGLARALVARRGVILVAGAPGSGVTSTLYAAAHYIDRQRQVPGLVASIERPVRQDLPFIHQSEVGAGRPVAMFEALLGQREHEVIVVRHLDEPELIERAFAAAEGRLILGSLPARSALEAAQRAARHVGAAAVSQRLLFSLGQRLVRRTCPACRVEIAPDGQQRAQLTGLGLSPDEAAGPFFEGRGCDVCRQTGFAGRLPLYEWITGGGQLAALLMRGPDVGDRPADQLYREPENGALVDAALAQALAGETTVADLVAAALSQGQPAEGDR